MLSDTPAFFSLLQKSNNGQQRPVQQRTAFNRRRHTAQRSACSGRFVAANFGRSDWCFRRCCFCLPLFIIPIGDLLTRSTDDTRINYQLPLTFAILKHWDRQELPNEEIYEALFRDLGTVNKYLIENNYADTVDPNDPAWKVAIPEKGPYREAMLEIAPDWQSPKRWLPLQENCNRGLQGDGNRRRDPDCKNQS